MNPLEESFPGLAGSFPDDREGDIPACPDAALSLSILEGACLSQPRAAGHAADIAAILFLRYRGQHIETGRDIRPGDRIAAAVPVYAGSWHRRRLERFELVEGEVVGIAGGARRMVELSLPLGASRRLGLATLCAYPVLVDRPDRERS